jgi:hypothetical protein
MANLNIRKPRFYVDRLNYLLSRGVAPTFTLNVEATSGSIVGLKNTNNLPELIDMRPLNQVEFDTASNVSDHVVTSYDFAFGSYKTNFIAILNHNMKSADARFKISYDTSTAGHVRAVDFPDALRVQPTQVFNGAVSNDSVNDSDSELHKLVTPSADGSTIMTFNEIDSRYFGIQFEGITGNQFSSTDLKIGCIIIGEYYDMPHSPDLSVKRSIVFDKQNVQESVGGQRFSTLSSYGKSLLSTTNFSPFQTYIGNDKRGLYGGRMTYDMKFSYLNSSDVMPTTYDVQTQADDTVVSDIWNYTHGSHIPFIFTQDGTSTDESDYLFARFGQNSLDMTQVAPDVFDVSMRIEEEF